VTLANLHVGATQLRNNLINRVALLLHLKESFPGLRPVEILSQMLAQF
jgi:hypothetical protein